MEETLEGGQGPPWAVAPLERERENILNMLHTLHIFLFKMPFIS
jgi:hypothetical protein